MKSVSKEVVRKSIQKASGEGSLEERIVEGLSESQGALKKKKKKKGVQDAGYQSTEGQV